MRLCSEPLGVIVFNGRDAAAADADPLNDDGAAFAGVLGVVVVAAGLVGGLTAGFAVPGGFAVVGVFPIAADLVEGAAGMVPEAAVTVRVLALRRTPGLGVSGSTSPFSDAASSTGF